MYKRSIATGYKRKAKAEMTERGSSKVEVAKSVETKKWENEKSKS